VARKNEEAGGLNSALFHLGRSQLIVDAAMNIQAHTPLCQRTPSTARDTQRRIHGKDIEMIKLIIYAFIISIFLQVAEAQISFAGEYYYSKAPKINSQDEQRLLKLLDVTV
jgi:hypothetical protein